LSVFILQSHAAPIPAHRASTQNINVFIKNHYLFFQSC
jgi:hypothetical protein